MTQRMLLLLLAALLALVCADAVRAQNDDERRMTFNFKNADLDIVLQSLSKTLKLTFIKETTVEGKLTAVSDRPVPRNRAIAFLNSALIRYNVAAVEVGDVVKIVTLEDAKRLNHSIRYGSDPSTLKLGDNIITQVIPLQYLDANQVKKELNDLTSKTGQFLLNTRANVILLTDTESNVKRFLTIIKQLDQAVQEVLKVKLYRLKYAGAAELGKAIDQLFAPIQAPQQQQQQRGGRGGGGFMQQMMRRFSGAGGAGAGASLASQVVRTTVEERTNTLIVTASDNTIKAIDKLVEELDKPVTELLVIRIYPLQNAEAAAVVKIIEQMFEGSTQKQQQPQQRARGGPWQRMMQMAMAQGQQKGSSGPQQTIKVTADERTNAVVVAASKENQELLGSLVRQLDSQTVDQEVRIYTLQNADAEELKKTLEEVFDLEDTSQRGAQPQGRRGAFQQRGGRGQQGQQGQQGVKPTDKVRVSADKRTNSLIITAQKGDFGSIEKIVKQLDSDNSDNESTLVIKLTNAKASTLRPILNNLFSDSSAAAGARNQRGQRSQTTATSTTARVGALTGQVKVQADAESNSLIFVTASRNFDTIRRLVDELDAERPQVLIRSYIVEVDLDGTTELGVEFSYTDRKDKGETGADGTTKESTKTYSSDFDVAGREGGFRFRRVRDDFEVLLRALRKDGKLNVLSAPRVLVQDNQRATINIGQEVPFVTNTRLTNEGTTLNTIQYRDVGIILTVTPTINPKGLVKMVVAPEVSEIAPESQSVQITEGVRSPVFLKNTASTTITVRDGQTIVLGGMIMDRVRESDSKIPILGDIPLIGFLFGSRVHDSKKVELMIFVTPYVVNHADELQDVTQFEIANLRLIDAKPILRRSLPKLPIDLLDD